MAQVGAAVAVATPTPASATNASSGNTTAAAGVANSSTINTQLLAGAAGGGTSPLTVANQHASSVTDSSSASAQSGLSVALAPTVMAGTPVPTGVTTASSGNTSATGLLAQNTVSNTSVGAVQVVGANQAKVSAISSSSVDIRDTAASGAASGAAWAVANGASGSPSGVATPAVAGAQPASAAVSPAVAGAQPASAAVSSTGLVAQNNVSNAVAATVTVPGGPQTTPHAISVTSSQAVNVNQGGAAAAVSVPVAASAPGAATDARAASGSTSAVGLSAQNTVSTNANVAVHVGGQNFAPIQVIVDSVTRIFNLGVASSTSGDVTAGSGGAGGGVTQPVASGSAQATGAQVQSTVDLHSSAAVRVNGDNYNPISIVLNLAANLVNWGAGLARSGDAQAGGAASSGAVTASGLQVMNLVGLWADASVDIQGNNYAPIFIRISFITNIDNRGVAGASSGNVAAGKAGSSTTRSASAPSTGPGRSTSSGFVGSSSKAIGGDATSISNSVDAHVQSTQLSSANGSKPITALTVSQMLRNLPTGSWDPFLDQALPADSQPAVEAGLASRSGNALASGLHSQIDQTNTQLVACKDPQVSCVAANLASLSIVAQDSKTNPATQSETGGPGPGGVFARSGSALANATPTPTPTPKTSTGGGGHANAANRGSASGGAQKHDASGGRQFLATAELVATGHLVLVDLWDQWPGRRLPPMPNSHDHAPTITTVSVSLGGWPGANELPLPDLVVSEQPGPGQTSRARVQGGLTRPASVDAAAEDPEEFPVMQLVDVDPWPIANDLQMLPMPMPMQAAAPLASAPAPEELTAAAEPDDAGVTPLEVNPAALLALVGGLIGLRQRRRSLRLLKQIADWRVALVQIRRRHA